MRGGERHPSGISGGRIQTALRSCLVEDHNRIKPGPCIYLLVVRSAYRAAVRQSYTMQRFAFSGGPESVESVRQEERRHVGQLDNASWDAAPDNQLCSGAVYLP